MKKSYLLLAIGFILSLFNIGMFLDSFEKVADDWGGVSFDFNMSYLVYFIVSLLFTGYAYLMYKEEINKEDITKE